MDQDQDVSPVDILPDEMLLMIFKYLSVRDLELSASTVCRRWKCLISHIVARVQSADDYPKIHGGLTALYVTKYIPSLHTYILALHISSMKNLKELTICVDHRLEVEDLKLIETLQNLCHLDVFTKQHLDKDTPLPRNITSLVVNSDMVPGFLSALKRNNRGFKAFHMYGKAKIFPSKQMDMFLQENSSCLTELTLRCSYFENEKYETISKCEGLTSLQLYVCWQLTYMGARALTKLANLRQLHVTGMILIRSKRLVEFIRDLPQRIEDLNLSYTCFGNEHCSALARRLPMLRRLELWRTRVTPAALLKLINALSALQIVDTDVILHEKDIRALSGHRSMRNIRCSIGCGVKEMRHKFVIRSASAQATLIRADEEGPSAGLFYYWLRPPL